ncbi:hypothetical protein BH20ACI4_BH20ACI4_23110 [soil metagenome]
MKFANRPTRVIMGIVICLIYLSGLSIKIKTQVQEVKSNIENKLSQTIELSARFDKDSNLFKIGEPITLILTIENNSDTELYFIESNTSRDYKIDIKNEQGEKVSLTKNGQRLTSRSTSVWRNKLVKLEPGKARQAKINIAHLYEMSAKGKYYISVSRMARKGESEFIKLESEMIEIVVE